MSLTKNLLDYQQETMLKLLSTHSTMALEMQSLDLLSEEQLMQAEDYVGNSLEQIQRLKNSFEVLNDLLVEVSYEHWTEDSSVLEEEVMAAFKETKPLTLSSKETVQ